MLCEQFLNSFVVEQLVSCEAQDLECLLFGNEATLYPKALISHVLATNIGVLVRLRFIVLLVKVVSHLDKPQLLRNRSYIDNIFRLIGFTQRLNFFFNLLRIFIVFIVD